MRAGGRRGRGGGRAVAGVELKRTTKSGLVENGGGGGEGGRLQV